MSNAKIIDLQKSTLNYQYSIPPPSIPHVTIDESEIAGRRIFIVGDIHGCLDEFEELLLTASAKPNDTLVVCVGDLVNKGPKSCETLSFIRSLGHENIRSVRGNHDERVCCIVLCNVDSVLDQLTMTITEMTR